jgi:guanylate kinase
MTLSPGPRRGLMIVFSSPSGAGKSTLSRLLLARDSAVRMSVSATTRAPRPDEVDGRDYVFLDRETFERRAAAGEFLESAQVFDHYYGTPAGPVEEALAAGHDVLFDIDWQGTQQLAQKAPADLVTIFILPPSLAELERRLTTRAQDSVEVVARRMAKADQEISHWAEYDYVIINDDLEESLAKIRTILAAERMKRARQPGLADFVKKLMEG